MDPTLSRSRLVLAPAVISLGVKLLRLAGERLDGSEEWFSKATGGIAPSAVTDGLTALLRRR